MQLFCLCKLKLSRQTLLAMKLTTFVLLALLFQASATGNAQNVTLSVRDMPVKKVFSAIKKQTGFVFFYDAELMKKAHPVSLNLKNVPINNAMDYICKSQGFTWTMNRETITLIETVGRIKEETKQQGIAPITVQGIVTDENDLPLEGVNVVVKGTKIGTSTTKNGAYFFSKIDENAVLLFSIVGYNSHEESVKGRKLINVKMVIAPVEQEEVQVASTGYQLISKERATGSYDLVLKDQLEKPTTNIGSRLIGQVAGMSSKFDVNGNPTFEIRGQTSLYANASPLIVVDGFAVQGDLSTINPNDVESVTILKDAAAASIWGARSANGVIVVVTKKAKKNTPLKIDVSVFTKMGEKMDLDYVKPLASSAETVDFEKLIFNKSWSPFINTGSFNADVTKQNSAAAIAMYENSFGYMTEAEMNNVLNHLKTLDNRSQISKHLLANPTSKQVNLNLYGGSERMSNNLSLLFEKNQTNFKESDNSRYMINYRTQSKVFNWLDFNFSGFFQMNDTENSGVSLGDIQGLAPYDMLLNNDGSYADVSRYYWPILNRMVPMSKFPYSNWTYNPIQEIKNRDFKNKQILSRLQAGLTFKLLKGLSFDSKIQWEKSISENRNYYNDSTFYVRSTVNHASTWNMATNAITPNLPKGGILTMNKVDVEAYNFRNQLNFNRQFGQHHELNFVGGSEVNNIITQATNNPTTYGYNNNTLTVGTFPNGPGGSFAQIKNWLGNNQNFSYINTFSYRTDRYFSLYGNLAYTFMKKYTISGSARTDASNLISDDPSYRYAPFWSVGGTWNVMREKFMQPATWVDDLRLRATYGYNGNVDKSTAFMPLIAMASSPNIYTNDFTASISSYGNPTLRWEKTGTWNIGVDFSLMNSKLFGKVDFYNKSGKDLIATLSIPSVFGTTSQKLNNAAMTNKGIELSLGTRASILNNDIVWSGNLNFSYNKNKITKLFVANYAAYNLYGGGTAAYVVGKDANTLWSFEYAGIRQADKQPIVKGAGTDTYDFTAWTPGDGRNYMLDMGTKVAPYTLGFTSMLKLYDFDFSFIVTGKFGHVFNRQSFNYPVLSGGRVLPNNQLSEVVNGDPNKVVPMPLNDNEPRFYFWDRFYPYLSYLVESASHVRMQEMNLTYRVPTKLLQKAKLMGDIRLFAQANNMFTILANKYGEDPEFPKGGMKPQAQYTFGARIIF